MVPHDRGFDEDRDGESLRTVSLCIFLFFIAVFPSFVGAGEPVLIKRQVLAFYDPQNFEDMNEVPIHRHLEVILNHLGLDVIYRSTRDPLPAEEEMSQVRAVLTWFFEDEVFSDPDAYCRWLSDRMARGVKWVALGKPGFSRGGDHGQTPPSCEQAFRDLGADYLGESSIDELFIEIVEKDSRMVEFERPLNFTEDLRYVLIRPVDAAAKVYLKLRRTDMDDSVSSLVFTTARGGFANAGLVVYEDKVLSKIKWRLNPFLFFEEAFALKGLPRPDISTLNGRRVFMTHIDGDGIFNLSHIDRKSFSGEVILDEILKKYDDIPHSVSIITGYLDMPEYQDKRANTLYSNLFSLENVEPAAHGHAHPLIWKKGTVAVQVPGYDFDPKYEIQGSVTRVRELLKSLQIDKPVHLFFWTGDCLPTAEQLSMAREFDLLHINGGDSRFDRIFDSYAFLSPNGLSRGGERQIYASFPNENVFTNLWKGPFYGFRDIVESFRNTESPVRLKAIDIYYHFYTGERMAALRALSLAFEYALAQKIFPIFESDYILMARDFFDARLSVLASGGFRIENAGKMRTVRFDETTRNLDLARSSGVIGFSHYQGSLYVHLDDSATHDVYLTETNPSRPFVEEASFHVHDFAVSKNKAQFYKKGWGESVAVLGGFSPKRIYKVTAGSEVQSLVADSAGRLAIKFEKSEGGGAKTEVKIESF